MQGKVATSEFQRNRVYRLEPSLKTGRGYDSTALSGSHTWTAFVRRECFGGGAREADLPKLALGMTLQEECERCWGGAGEDITVNTIHPLPCGSHPSTKVPCLSVALFLLPEGSTGLGGFHPSSSLLYCLPDCGRGILPLGAG